MAKRVKTFKLELVAPKKTCGKYVVESSKADPWPKHFYIAKEWFGGDLPKIIHVSLEA